MKKTRGGFTLLELVVVLAIFSVLAVLAYGGLNTVLTLRTRVAQALERTAALQKGYVRLRNDFQQLRARPARDGFGATQAALLLRSDGGVEFTRSGWRNPLSQPRAALERVAYRLDDEGRLLRESWRVLDRAQDSEPASVAVIDKVEEARWRFLDADLQWRDRWPVDPATPGQAVAGSEPPPLAVELTLELKDLGEVRLLFGARNYAAP
ncbi:MAG TPA: type II secretion system minor pseudopilin GspJ [Verrucomicrobiae bacterium]|nr:type II secretion system minor pseudopilin GspJ [Verrucomicrobiae bacterium]